MMDKTQYLKLMEKLQIFLIVATSNNKDIEVGNNVHVLAALFYRIYWTLLKFPSKDKYDPSVFVYTIRVFYAFKELVLWQQTLLKIH